MRKFWKPFRIIISMVTLAAMAFIFLDFRQQIPSSGYRTVTFLQFIPSLRNFLIAAGLLSSGFLVVILFTLLFGRVYCSTVCPLGILQDVINFFSRKFRGKKFRFKYTRAKNLIRYSFLALAVIPLFFGMISTVGLLDPYSNFGRIFSGLGQPLYTGANNLLSGILLKMEFYVLFPEQLPVTNLAAMAYPILFLVILLVMASKWGRLYCNTVCPVGTLLGLLSRISLFKIKIDPGTCTKCAKCAIACKSQCINLKDQTVDFSRCVACFNCVNACQDNSISYKPTLLRNSRQSTPRHTPSKNTAGAHGTASSPNGTGLSKRQFIAGSLALAGTALGIYRKAGAEETAVAGKAKQISIKKEYPCSPPGSVSLKHFNDTCTACHLCVSACPNGVLRPSLLEYGLEGFLQPLLDPASGYCNFDCTVCGEICPAGAILPLTKEEKHVTQVGIVRFVKQNCVVFTDETLCGACSEHCPTKAVIMVPYKNELNIPEVNPAICVGCGACEHACPVRPHRAIYVDGLAVQRVAEKPHIEKNTEGALEAFPF
ncbi:MAG: 4Fe-4S binding protein [Mangrovibacterium sp.]